MSASVSLPPLKISTEDQLQLNIQLNVLENSLNDTGGTISVRLCDNITYKTSQIDSTIPVIYVLLGILLYIIPLAILRTIIGYLVNKRNK